MPITSQTDIDNGILEDLKYKDEAQTGGTLADFTGQDFRGYTLKDRILAQVPIKESDLRGVDCTGTDFRYCDMTNVLMDNNTILIATKFWGVDVSKIKGRAIDQELNICQCPIIAHSDGMMIGEIWHTWNEWQTIYDGNKTYREKLDFKVYDATRAKGYEYLQKYSGAQIIP